MGYVAYQTPRSGDHGVDVFVESRDTLASGRIVISAKRYNSTVGPDHVRDSVVGGQGAINGILVSPRLDLRGAVVAFADLGDETKAAGSSTTATRRTTSR
jgi:hypothetical protein